MTDEEFKAKALVAIALIRELSDIPKADLLDDLTRNVITKAVWQLRHEENGSGPVKWYERQT